MKNNLFDSYVKEQLGSYTPDVPAHIWENIAAETGRKRPIGFWGQLGGLHIVAALLLLTGGAGFIYFVNHSKPAIANLTSSATLIMPALISNPVTTATNGPITTNATSSVGKNNIADVNITGLSQPLSPVTPVSSRGADIFHPVDLFKQPVKENDQSVTNSLAEVTGSVNDETGLNLHLNRSTGLAVLKNSMRFEPGLWSPFRSLNLSIPCPTAEKNASGNKRYIEIYGGPDYVFNDISDPALSTYLQQRKASTHPLMSFSMGIRYTKVFGSGMSIRTGLNYSQVNEAFKSVKGQVTQNVYITNTQGDTTGTYTVTGTQYNENTNKYRTIDIPLVAGYEFGNGRLHANLNAGAMINISSKHSGYVLDTNGAAVDISSGKNSSVYKYKTNAGVSLTGGLSVYYKLNDNLHVMAEPYFRYSLSPVTQSALTLKQKYHTAGLRLGVRLDF